MTTIILDRISKTLYADKQETFAKGVKIFTNKIAPVYINEKHWGWYGQSGDSAENVTYLHYLSNLSNFEEIKEKNENRHNWKDLAGILVDMQGNVYQVHSDGTPYPIYTNFTADGAGYLYALILNDIGISVPEIFKAISKRTNHTSAEFDSVQYGKKNAKIIYNQKASED